MRCNKHKGSATSKVATVNVIDPIPVTKLSLTAPNTMNVGTNAQCTVTISPDNATNQNVTWESSAPSIIEVDQNGNLTAKSTGTATITVSSQDGGGVIPVSKEITVLASNSANGTYVEMVCSICFKIWKCCCKRSMGNYQSRILPSS